MGTFMWFCVGVAFIMLVISAIVAWPVFMIALIVCLFGYGASGSKS